jgi:hypothetical protein
LGKNKYSGFIRQELSEDKNLELKIWGSLAHDVRTYYSSLQQQELEFYRTVFAILQWKEA